MRIIIGVAVLISSALLEKRVSFELTKEVKVTERSSSPLAVSQFSVN